ncbi:MAG: RNA polymerase sigma factor [Planctomycetota bacterium]
MPETESSNQPSASADGEVSPGRREVEDDIDASHDHETDTETGSRRPLSDAESAMVAGWWTEHGKALRGFARRRLSDTDAVEDVVQDALLSAAVALGRGEEMRDERAFLFTVLRRRIMDYLRRLTSRRRVQDEFSEIVRASGPSVRDQVYAIARSRWNAPPERAMEQAEFWKRFDECLAELPPLMRQAMVLREIDGHDTEVVCETLGLTKSNLWTLVHRARLKLRARLTPLMSDSNRESPEKLLAKKYEKKRKGK